MSDASPLDLAQSARLVAPDDAAAEGVFFRLLADAVLFVLLEEEAQGEVLTPRVFDLTDGPVLLAFDSEERLASLGDRPLPYAALPGRVIAAQMAGPDFKGPDFKGQRLALGLNLGTGVTSEMLLPAGALDWMLERLATSPQEVVAAPEHFYAPKVPDTLITTLRENLAAQPGLMQAALLAGVRYQGGRLGHLLAVIGADAAAEPALARAVAEALAFSGLDAGEIDVVFLAPDAPLRNAIARHALSLDLTAPAVPPALPPTPPGMDKTRPPKLR